MSKSNAVLKEEPGCPQCAAITNCTSELIKYFRKHVPPMPKVDFVVQLHSMVDTLEKTVLTQGTHVH